MKKFVILFLSLFVSIGFFGQKVHYSIEVGGGFDFMTVNHFPKSGLTLIDYGSAPKSVFHMNNYFTIPVNKTLAFRTGFGISTNKLYRESSVTYNVQAFEQEHGYPDGNSQLSTIDSILTGSIYTGTLQKSEENYDIYLLRIPLQLQLNLFKEKLFIFSGISISYVLDAKKQVSLLPDNMVFSANNSFHNSFSNVNFGFEYRIWKKLSVGLLYEYSISEIMPYYNIYYASVANEYYKFHLNTASLNLSCKF